MRAGVVGASGYTGGELCRLLLSHPRVDEILPTSRDGGEFERVHRNLLGSGLRFTTPEELAERAGELDVVFFCTPAGEAMAAAPRFLDAGARVVDLSVDFRFKDAATYERVYGIEHGAPELLERAVYGVPELNRDEVAGADLVANPGCYVVTALLGLAPLVRDPRVDLDQRIRIHAVNGTTGAGTTPKRATQHAEVVGDVLPYAMEGHRHGPELEDQLARIAGRPVTVDFNTAHGDFARGIYLQASLDARDGELDRGRLLECFRSFYGDRHQREHYVLVNAFPKNGGLNAKEYDVYPSVASVVGSNFCHVGVDYDSERRIVKVISVTDNLGKGAAGSAVQNMNLMLGFDEREGIAHYGL